MDENNIKVLERALLVLDTVKDSEQPLGVNEIAKICSLSPATTFRILRTFKNGGWVYQDKDEKYTIGHKISYLTERRQFRLALRETAYFIMAKLTKSEHEAMNLVVRDYDQCRILEQSRTDKIVDYVPPIGTILPLHASACAKILLSELSARQLADILDGYIFQKLTSHTIDNRESYLDALALVREKGYALDEHESQEEGFCIAVPIRASDGEIIAALSFSGFIGQKNVNEIDYYVRLLKSASDEITKRLFCIIT